MSGLRPTWYASERFRASLNGYDSKGVSPRYPLGRTSGSGLLGLALLLSLLLFAGSIAGCSSEDNASSGIANPGKERGQPDLAASQNGTDGGKVASCGALTSVAIARLEGELEGLESEVALIPAQGDQGVTKIGEVQEPYARSTIKVVILAALIAEEGGIENLSQTELELAGLAIRDSNNDAARSLYLALAEKTGSEEEAAAAMDQVLRKGGDPNTTVPPVTPDGLPPSFISNYGATLWPAEDQARFMRGLLDREILDEASTNFILTLMSEITSLGGSGWGLGAVGGDLNPRYKPGWGDNPAGDFLARQMGAISLPEPGKSNLSLSVISIGPTQDDAYFRASEASRLTIDSLKQTCS